jgi:hypothetical protein
MSRRKVKVTREFFINHCANWLPENRNVFVGFLKLEEEGRVSFYIRGQSLIIRDNRTYKDRLIGGGSHGRNRSKA